MGTAVTAVLAGDADVRGGDSWQVDYCLESGNEEEVFTLVTDKQTNEVSLVLSKVRNTHINWKKKKKKYTLNSQGPILA